MSTSQKLITKALGVSGATNFIDEVQQYKSAYYVYAGNNKPYTDDTIPEFPSRSITDVYNSLILGKKITPQDVAFVIPKYIWASGTIYDQYTDKYADLTVSLYDKKFYVAIQNGSFYIVYKCLNNNNGAQSTQAPYGTDADPFFTADGYSWIYMYSIAQADFDKFATTYYMPVPDMSSEVIIERQASAKPGTIDNIVVLDGGAGYTNYFKGYFRAEDINVSVVQSSLVYGISDTYDPEVASFVNRASDIINFYVNCIITINPGTSQAQSRLITAYATTPSKQITIDQPFDSSLLHADTPFEITPAVFVYGDGNETITCVARAIVDLGVVTSVEILDTGRNYRDAQAIIIPSTAISSQVGFVPAELQPIISPILGHGSDPLNELGASNVCVSVKFIGDEGLFLWTGNQYRHIGILKNPEYTDIGLNLDTTKTFRIGETVYLYDYIALAGRAAVVESSTTINGVDTYFNSSLKAGDYIMLADGDLSLSTTNKMFTSVTDVVNDGSIVVATQPSWSTVADATSGIYTATVFLLNLVPYGIVSDANPEYITLTHVKPNAVVLKPTNNIIGGSTYITSSVLNTEAYLGNVPVDNYLTFSQLSLFFGTLADGTTFTLNDPIIQDMNVPLSQKEFIEPSGTLFFYDSGTLLANDIKRNFLVGSDIIADPNKSDSTGKFTVSAKYNGNLVKNSGEVFYIEAVDPISRYSNRSETIQIILSF